MTDLITLQDYKSIVGVTSSNNDSIVSSHIPAVSEAVKNYCNRRFLEFWDNEKTEYFSIRHPTRALFLKENPIRSIISVSERENPASDYTVLTADNDYVIDTELDAIYRINSDGSYSNFKNGIDSIKVIYTAGFENTPEDLKLAIVDLINYFVDDEHVPSKNNMSFTMKNEISSSIPNNTSWPDHIKRILDTYRSYG